MIATEEQYTAAYEVFGSVLADRMNDRVFHTNNVSCNSNALQKFIGAKNTGLSYVNNISITEDELDLIASLENETLC